MKSKILIAAGMMLVSASAVKAQSIEGVTMTSDPNDVVFTVRADKALGAPSVKTYEGSLRVRFPDSSTPNSISTAGDGAAIKNIDLRSGSHDSSVLRLELGDNTKLSSDDVRIEPRKNVVVVRIARDLLPPLREPKLEEPKKKAEAAAVAAAPAQPKPAAPAETKPEPKSSIAPAPLALAPKPAAALAKKPNAPLASSMASGSSPMPMLLGISAILALAYGALRLAMRKQATGARAPAPIDIVAQKRIGPRHQLVIVRAFGREHLLSIQGGTTTPIATSDELEEPFSEKLAAATRIEPSTDLVRDVAISQRPVELAAETRGEATQGGDMIRAALAQRLSAATKRARSADADVAPARNKEEKALSQAVAGLVRLRREAQL